MFLVWRKILNCKDCEVSDEGEIRKTSTGMIYKTQINKNGYKQIGLITLEGKSKKFYVHRLVAEYFCNNVDLKKDVNHKNGDKTDNRAVNLEWCTRGENLKHSYQVLKRPPNIPSLKKVAKIKDGKIIEVYSSIAEASRKNNTCYQNISAVINGRQKTAIGFHWEVIE